MYMSWKLETFFRYYDRDAHLDEVLCFVSVCPILYIKRVKPFKQGMVHTKMHSWLLLHGSGKVT